MLYDGSCPLCVREVSFLRGLRGAPRVRFTDVASPSFDPALVVGPPGHPQPVLQGRLALLESLHVVDLRSGAVHTRVPAFRMLYRTLFGIDILAWTRFWPWAGLADRAYGVVAAHKHRLAWLVEGR